MTLDQHPTLDEAATDLRSALDSLTACDRCQLKPIDAPRQPDIEIGVDPDGDGNYGENGWVPYPAPVAEIICNGPPRHPSLERCGQTPTAWAHAHDWIHLIQRLTYAAVHRPDEKDLPRS